MRALVTSWKPSVEMRNFQRSSRTRTSILIAGLLTGAVGCTAHDFVANGPPGPTPSALVAIYEATVRYYFRPPYYTRSRSSGPPAPTVVVLKCDLDESHRSELIERLTDMPVDFRPPDEEGASQYVSLGRARFSIATKWVNDGEADLIIGHYYGSQGTVYKARVDYEEGAWHFQWSRLVAVVN